MSDEAYEIDAEGEELTPGYRGILFVISSPSGGGKGTLIRRVLGKVPGLSYSVSWTTRAPRPGERDGVSYHFVTPGEFERMREAGGFLEWAVVHGNYYGTARSVVAQELSEGHDIILLDVSQVSVVTSSGIAALFDLLRFIRSRGGDVRLFGVSPAFSEAREALRLTSVMPVYPAQPEAAPSTVTV